MFLFLSSFLQLRLSPPGAEVAGVALTAALSSVAPKRGELACFVATRSSAGATLRSVSFAKGARDRAEEDRVASRLLIRTLAEACGVASDVPPPLLDEAAGERHFREDSPVGCARISQNLVSSLFRLSFPAHFFSRAAGLRSADAIGALLAGRVGCVELTRGAATGVGACRARVLLCGSFNPLHDGHTALLAAAVAAVAPPADESVESGAGGGYELSVRNADKAPLQRAELERRAAAFAPDPHPLVLTNAPLFADKAELLPGTVFVVGVDTALRILDPKYYVPPSTSAPVPGAAAGASAAGAGEEGLRACLRRIARTRCSFLIAGRVVGGGVFVGPDALRVPPGFEHLFCPLPSFRRDISSTQLRERAAAAGGAAARGGA